MTMGPWKVFETLDDEGKVVERTIHTVWEHGQLHGPAPVVTSCHGIMKVRGVAPFHGVHIDKDDAELIASAPDLKAERDRLLLQNEELKNLLTEAYKDMREHGVEYQHATPANLMERIEARIVGNEVKRSCQCPKCGVSLSGPLVQRCVNGCDF